MNATNCLDILREIKDVAFATVDKQGKPQVRIIDVMIVENDKLYFCTARGKDFYDELITTKCVAITGVNKEWQMIRLSGSVRKLKEHHYWMDRIFNDNPSMNQVYPGEARYILEAFVVEEAEIEFYDLSKKPIYRESFTIGEVELSKKGFEITDECIGCELCKTNCPQQCITSGTPYKINQKHCLQCGLCFENCPVKAIIKK